MDFVFDFVFDIDGTLCFDGMSLSKEIQGILESPD